MNTSAETLYRQLPSVHLLLQREEVQALLTELSSDVLLDAAQRFLARLREDIRSGSLDSLQLDAALANAAKLLWNDVQARVQPRLQRVINATGVILQTNLGRAPLSAAALERIQTIAAGYSNLEFDLARGERGRRDVHAEDLLLELLRMRCAPQTSEPTFIQSAAVVNNCAAATFLALNTLAEGGEVVVSRGELVEIGGGFRIPEILSKSGAILREVGTTNKTRLSDYANAVNANTRLILRVHRSNFRIEGFTAQPSLRELVELGQNASVAVFNDQGTGCVVDLEVYGVHGESSLLESVAHGATLTACSGDKLFGGAQCGLLLGERTTLDRIRANPLFRALRVDKLTYAALDATLHAYLTGTEDAIPVVAMLKTPAAIIFERCANLLQSIRPLFPGKIEIAETRSLIGGGTTPGASIASFALALTPDHESEEALATRLRGLRTPVIARISEGRVLLDLRTVLPGEDTAMAELFAEAFRNDAPLEQS